jgi:hemerythrin superfamily protein
MEKESITSLMVKHHYKIVEMLNTFEKKKDVTSFNNFKWELEKHIFIEERAIFSISENKTDAPTIIPDLLMEHKNMLSLMTDERMNIKEFKRLLTKHRNFEEAVFYPRLDKELDEQTKELIFKRIRDFKI